MLFRSDSNVQGGEPPGQIAPETRGANVAHPRNRHAGEDDGGILEIVDRQAAEGAILGEDRRPPVPEGEDDAQSPTAGPGHPDHVART